MTDKRTPRRARGVPAAAALFAFALAFSACGGEGPQNCAQRGFCDWGGWVVTRPPSCAAEGAEARTCRDCGEVVSRSVGETGHDWGGFAMDYPPTCTDHGRETRLCLDCGEPFSNPLPAFGHRWCDHGGDGWVTTMYPTDDDPGLQTRPCLNEGCEFIDSRALGRLVGHCGCDRECCERLGDCDDPRWNCRFPEDCGCPPV